MRYAIAFFPLLLLLLVGAAIALIYFIMYRKKINRIVTSQNESDDPDAFTARDSAGPEPSSVSNTLFKVGAVLIIVILLIKLSNANNSLNALANNVNNLSRDVQALQYRINSLSSDSTFEDSALTDFDLSLGKFNSADNTAELNISVTPKNANADTKIGVNLGGLYTELVRGAGSIYTGTLNVNIFELLPDSFTFSITDGASTVTENCDANLGAVWPKVIPTAQVRSNGNYTAGSKLKLDFEIDISLGETDFAAFKNEGIRMVETLGDEVLSDTDISSGFSRINGDSIYHLSLDKKISGAEGKDYSIKIFAEDTAGYRHEIDVLSISDRSGGTDPLLFTEKIFGADGTLLNADTYSVY